MFVRLADFVKHIEN